MKPAWDKLMEAYADHKTALVADVDCTTEGKDLCETHEVQGFPTIKWGDPSGLEDYKGGRDFDSLKKFADENLKPVCSPSNKDLCDADKKKQIEDLEAMDGEKLDEQIKTKEAEMTAADEKLKEGLKGLQERYEKLSKEKDEAVDKVQASGLKWMNAVMAVRRKAYPDGRIPGVDPEPTPEEEPEGEDDEFLINKEDFGEIDKDKDGKATKEEFEAFAKAVVPGLLPEGSFPYVAKWDTDRDKKITAEEFAKGSGTGGSGEKEKVEWVKQRLWAQLDEADKDKDAKVTFDELKAAGHAEDDAEKEGEGEEKEKKEEEEL